MTRVPDYMAIGDFLAVKQNGLRHFYTDETGIIRYGLEQVADSNSSALQ